MKLRYIEPSFPVQELTNLLISYGADLNAVENILHFTPLSFAVKYPEIVKMLLKYGANPNICTHSSSCLALSREVNKYDISAAYIVAYIVLYEYGYKSNNNNSGFLTNMSIINSNTSLIKIKKDCETELKKIKSIKLNDKYYLDALLTNNDIKDLTLLVNNHKLKNFDTCCYPHYGHIIEKI